MTRWVEAVRSCSVRGWRLRSVNEAGVNFTYRGITQLSISVGWPGGTND